MKAWAKLQRAGRELMRHDLSASERVVRLGQRFVDAGGLEPRVSVKRNVVVEMKAPPKELRGLRDLVVRRASERDVAVLGGIDDTPPDRVRERLARGDAAYLGQIGERVVCKTWFHPGPAPFDEDTDAIVSWSLEQTTFWSYNGAAAQEAMATGVFIKMFVVALRELFEHHGATRILGYIRDTNQPSLALHDRLGFSRVGTLITVAVPGLKWVHYRGGQTTKQWLVRRSRPFSFAVPPG